MIQFNHINRTFFLFYSVATTTMCIRGCVHMRARVCICMLVYPMIKIDSYAVLLMHHFLYLTLNLITKYSPFNWMYHRNRSKFLFQCALSALLSPSFRPDLANFFSHRLLPHFTCAIWWMRTKFKYNANKKEMETDKSILSSEDSNNGFVFECRVNNIPACMYCDFANAQIILLLLLVLLLLVVCAAAISPFNGMKCTAYSSFTGIIIHMHRNVYTG